MLERWILTDPWSTGWIAKLSLSVSLSTVRDPFSKRRKWRLIEEGV